MEYRLKRSLKENRHCRHNVKATCIRSIQLVRTPKKKNLGTVHTLYMLYTLKKDSLLCTGQYERLIVPKYMAAATGDAMCSYNFVVLV